MPAPGEQHTSWANPFEESRPKISEWTAKEIATIAARLDKQLGPEYISSRAGPGGSRVHYLTAEKCICLANEVFGFNGWSSSIQNIQVDFADENAQTQRVSIGLSVIVRVTLRDGTYHEDIGYGSIENARGKAMAFEKAKKEGTTDALKRTLRSFGNVLGNCIYDQSYVKQVTKIKAQPVKKFEETNLHRHADFVRQDGHGAANDEAANANSKAAAIAQSSAIAPVTKVAQPIADLAESFEEDFLGDFDEADFNVAGDGHPDEIIVPTAATSTTVTTLATAPSTGHTSTTHPQSRNANVTNPPQTPGHVQNNRSGNVGAQLPPVVNSTEPVAFFSARSVAAAGSNKPNQSNQSAVHKQQLFNPNAESPSIRKTPGIDHSSSKPVSRSGQHILPASQTSDTSTLPGNNNGFTPARQNRAGVQGMRGSAGNPSLDQTRRIGAPGISSPLSNRGQYKPPTMKRPLPNESNHAVVGQRIPLGDVPTNGAVTTTGENLTDTKRQKTT